MATVVNQFMSNQAYNRGAERNMVDPSVSGQYGHVPDHRVWANQTPHVASPVFARVIRSPRGFNDMYEPQKWHGALKAIVERHTRSINGLDSSLVVDVRETPWGFAGEQFEVDANVTRNRSQVSLQLGADLYNLPFQAYVDAWIMNLIRNPDTKFADVTQFDPARRPNDLLADYRGAMILYFEPDRALKTIVKAWLQFNCWPKAGLPLTGVSDKAAGGEMLEPTLELTGITMATLGIKRFAQRFLNNIPLVGSSPYLQPSIVDAVSADLLAAQTGDDDNIARAAAEAIAL